MMSTLPRLMSVLLLSSALCSPALARAQDVPPPVDEDPAAAALTDPAEAPADSADAALDDGAASDAAVDGDVPPPEEEVDVSAPGQIVVTGRRDRNIAKSSDQVVSVLSSTEIARTGEGNIAGALGRVTGLSVVGSGYVYVRGLGDRYSLALLNGLPLPSPEPLKRVVPLDIFPSSVIASSLVQKSYSVNFPGEFGGGVINLTTRAVPQDPFFSIGMGVSGDTETTGQLGYTYYGSKSDWTGFDNGQRDTPPGLAAFLKSGERISAGNVDASALAGELVNSRNGIVQRWGKLPPNASLSFSGGKAFPLGEGELGIIAAAGYSNRFLTRETTQQSSLSADLSTIETDFTQVNTDQRIVVNALLGFGLEFGDNKLRWTNLYIRDTIKQARLALGNRGGTSVDFMQQRTAWYERQLIDTQFVGEFKLGSDVKLELRGSYANSQREAPGELFLEYVRTNSPADPTGAYFVNRLNNGNGGDARITFSTLNEDLWAAGIDLSYTPTVDLTLIVGAAMSDTHRRSARRDFQFLAPSNFPTGVGLFRPDYLLGPNVVDFFGIELIETDEGNPAFDARLENLAGYGKLNWQMTDTLGLDIGIRYEKAQQRVVPIQLFKVPGASTAGTDLDRAYWLPGATLTWQLQSDLQFRLAASKTIARPQFRELINQPYFDPDSNRPYRGNPLLVDSQLYNAEARVEWYFAPEQRLSVAGFFKKIDNPIESFLAGSELITSFANAPEAQLYGAEIEFQKFVPLSGLGGDEGFFAARRLVAVANYTFTKSKIKVAPGDTTTVFGAASTIAADYFRDGAPLTGQSDHIVNLQLGMEHGDRLSQQTLLLTYASDRVSSRGLNGSPPQPDVIERPGFRLDFVAREDVTVGGKEVELKFEVRNITGRRNQEFQQFGATRIERNSYKLGRSVSLSASIKF